MAAFYNTLLDCNHNRKERRKRDKRIFVRIIKSWNVLLTFPLSLHA